MTIIILFENFGNSIPPPIVLKRWYFINNLKFKSKIVANFFLRSYFLSVYDNMTIKQQINHEAIQFYSITTTVLCTKNINLWNEDFHKANLQLKYCIWKCTCQVIFKFNLIFGQCLKSTNGHIKKICYNFLWIKRNV